MAEALGCPTSELTLRNTLPKAEDLASNRKALRGAQNPNDSTLKFPLCLNSHTWFRFESYVLQATQPF